MDSEKQEDFSSFKLAGKRIAVPKAFAGFEMQEKPRRLWSGL
jgi:hypothetical protein